MGLVAYLKKEAEPEGDTPVSPEYAAKLISIATENGANGFIFRLVIQRSQF
jgi:hypothetical protein